MNCQACDDKGIVPFVHGDNPKSDDAIAAEDLSFALCLCLNGMAMRRTDNNGRKVPALWEVWCAREQVNHARVWRIESVYTPEELAVVGLGLQPVRDREAALLARSRAKR
jgi:hypothetical protein